MLGSSETLRGTPNELGYFCFDFYKPVMPLHKKKLNESFLQWFVGFTEGDGSFIISEKKSLRLFFCITQKDVRVLHYLRSELGFGRVYFDNSNKVGRYLVGDKENIERLCMIFLNNLVLSKVYARFFLWYSGFFQTSLNKNFPLLKKELLKPSLKDGWLSGFIDAEGCFNVTICRHLSYKSGYRIRLRFILDQKLELITLQYIKNLFQSGYIEIRSEERSLYRYVCCSMEGVGRVINYLTQYQLKTHKRIDFIKWKKVFNYLVIKKRLTDKDVIYIKTLIKKE